MAGNKNFVIGVDTGGTFAGVFVPGDGGAVRAATFRVVWEI